MLNRLPEQPRIAAGHAPAHRPAPLAFGPFADGVAPADPRALLGQFWKILLKHRRRMLQFIGLAMLLALVMQMAFPRLYSATALLKLDRHSAPGALGQEAAQISAINDMDEIITTDMELAQSDPVLRPVAQKYRLAGFGNSSSFWDRLFGRKTGEDASRRSRESPVELKGLKLTRPANTYLIRVTYRAWRDPQMAANVANGVAESLVKRVHDSLEQSYNDLSAAIRRDMEQLRSKMDVSSRRLTQYETELKIVEPEQRSTILTSRLTQLLAEYTAAQADRLHKQAAAEATAQSQTLADTQAMESGNQQRPSLLDEAIGRLSLARQQFVAARSYYAEKHPEYRKAKQQLDEAQAQVESLRVAANDKAAAEYRQALGRETLLKRQMQAARAEVDSLKARAQEYSQLKTEADNDRRIYMDLEARTREADVNRQFRDATIQFVAPALPPAEPIFPRLSVNLPVAFALALVLAVFGALAADVLDPTFSDAEDVSSRLRLAVLGSLPEMRGSAMSGRPESGELPSLYERREDLSGRYREEIRMLRNSIGLLAWQPSADRSIPTNRRVAASGPPGEYLGELSQSLRNILITSACAGEGKSTTAAQLAVACAEVGKKVLLIDADLRRPALGRKFYFNDKKIGLGDVLAQMLTPVDVIVELSVPGLFLMPAGPAAPHAADLISRGFAGVLSQVSANFDLVIVDAPPMLGLPETPEIAAMVDGVVIVTKAGATSARDLGETLAALARCGANLLGVVMNQVKLTKLRGFESRLHHYRREGREGRPDVDSRL